MRTRFTQAISRYVRVAPFPHITTLSMAGLSLLCGAEASFETETGNAATGALFWLLSCLFAWGILLCQADALSRFREFKRIRAILRRYGFKPRVLHPVSSSRCQRDAALLAASETGFRGQAHRYFTELGYRWYHILPDRIVSNPLYFFHPDFLRHTFMPRRETQE